MIKPSSEHADLSKPWASMTAFLPERLARKVRREHEQKDAAMSQLLFQTGIQRLAGSRFRTRLQTGLFAASA